MTLGPQDYDSSRRQTLKCLCHPGISHIQKLRERSWCWEKMLSIERVSIWPHNIGGLHLLKGNSVCNHFTSVWSPSARNIPDFPISQKFILNYNFHRNEISLPRNQCSLFYFLTYLPNSKVGSSKSLFHYYILTPFSFLDFSLITHFQIFY